MSSTWFIFQCQRYCFSLIYVVFTCLLLLVISHLVFVTHIVYNLSLWLWSPFLLLSTWNHSWWSSHSTITVDPALLYNKELIVVQMIFINPLVQMVYFIMAVHHETCFPTHPHIFFLKIFVNWILMPNLSSQCFMCKQCCTKVKVWLRAQ